MEGISVSPKTRGRGLFNRSSGEGEKALRFAPTFNPTRVLQNQ